MPKLNQVEEGHKAFFTAYSKLCSKHKRTFEYKLVPVLKTGGEYTLRVVVSIAILDEKK